MIVITNGIEYIYTDSNNEIQRTTDINVKLEDMTVDHIRPLALGGSNEVENLQCTCYGCNIFKNRMLPDTFFDRINEIYLYQMQKKYGKKLKWKLANKLIKSM